MKHNLRHARLSTFIPKPLSLDIKMRGEPPPWMFDSLGQLISYLVGGVFVLAWMWGITVLMWAM